MSSQFASFLTEFWDLPADSEFELGEKTARSLDNRFNSGLRPMWNNYTLRHKTWLYVDDEPYVPYTWTDRSIQDLTDPEMSFAEFKKSSSDD